MTSAPFFKRGWVPVPVLSAGPFEAAATCDTGTFSCSDPTLKRGSGTPCKGDSTTCDASTCCKASVSYGSGSGVKGGRITSSSEDAGDGREATESIDHPAWQMHAARTSACNVAERRPYWSHFSYDYVQYSFSHRPQQPLSSLFCGSLGFHVISDLWYILDRHYIGIHV